MNSRKLAALCAALTAALSIAAASASAAPKLGPVSFRVEGPSSTLVPLQTITTQAGTFTHDGNPAHACANASAAGVLQTATNGNWAGAFDTGQNDYFINTIAGVTAGTNQYWSLWYNHAPATSGACGQAVNSGDDVLFFIDCYGPGCPNGGNGYAVLSESAPSVAQAGSPVTIAVTSYDAATGAPTAAAGATVTAAGNSVHTDASGHATISFPVAGNFAVQATAMDSIRSEQRMVCVHNGNDGTCGTTAPGGSPTPTPPVPGLVDGAIGAPPIAQLLTRHRYRHGRGPRVLHGYVTFARALRAVRLRLTRRVGGRCSYFSGRAERFRGARCGEGFPFTVGNSSTFNYLLPARLGHGHYVVQAETVETNGKRELSAPVRFNVR